MQQQLLVYVLLAMITLASCNGGKWCKDENGPKPGSGHKGSGYPDRKGCCPEEAQQLTFLENFYNSTLTLCAFEDGRFFARYGADAVPPVQGKARGFYTGFLGVDNWMEVLSDGFTDQGTHWFNILTDGSVVGFSAADTDPFNPVVWNWQIISTERPTQCLKKCK